MKTKELLIRISLFFISLLVIYLCVGFVTLKFNFVEWEESLRFSYLIFSLFVGTMAATNPFINKP